MNVTGTGMVFKNEHITNGESWYSYNISITSKNYSGDFVSTTMPIRFKKGIELSDRARIDIKNGFLSVREYTKDGDKRKVIEIMCLDFETVKGASAERPPEGFASLQDEDIPF